MDPRSMRSPPPSPMVPSVEPHPPPSLALGDDLRTGDAASPSATAFSSSALGMASACAMASRCICLHLGPPSS